MQQMHGLPACGPKVSNNIEGGISATLQQRAFGGKLKRFELEMKKGEVDMLSLITNKKEEVDQLISDHVQFGPRRNWEMGLVKFLEEDDQSHKTILFVNTAMYSLYFGGVTDETIS